MVPLLKLYSCFYMFVVFSVRMIITLGAIGWSVIYDYGIP